MSVCRRSYSLLGVGVAVLLNGAAAAAPPSRVMSLNICTDQLLLALAPERRIASVTFMAREQAPMKLWPQAARIPVNYGSAEEILAAKPDLVLSGPFLPPLTRKILTQTGVTVVEVPLAETFDQIRAVTRQVAAALHSEARGEILIAHMNEDLRTAAKARPSRPIRIAQWGNGGHVPGNNGLFGAMLAVIGATSIADGAGFYDVEALIAGRPETLIYSDTYAGLATLRTDQNEHPALKAKLSRVSYASFYECGVPQMAASALKLQAELLKAVRR